jgi:hypothetical protein
LTVEGCWLAALPERRRKNGTGMDPALIEAFSRVVRHFEAREEIRGCSIGNWERIGEAGAERR